MTTKEFPTQEANEMAAAFAARWQPLLGALGVDRPGDIGWIHGANTMEALTSALSDPRIHFIESDISEVGGEIIMAHPPVTESDLAFETWLDKVIEAGKGAKLDFKSPAAMTYCLSYAARHALGKIPLGVNADILPGPGGCPPRFDPKEFLRLHNEFLPQAYLSLGWTVGAGGDGYTHDMIDAMETLLTEVDAPVSLCFHAVYMRAAWPRLKDILDDSDYTFTVWGRFDDRPLLSWLRARTPPERCFYDIQRGDGAQIYLPSL